MSIKITELQQELMSSMATLTVSKPSNMGTDMTVEKIVDSANHSIMVNDHYRNTLTSTGTADKVESFTSYGFNNDSLNWPLWLALYNDSWVFRRAIDKPAQDEITCGITIHGKSDYSKVYDLFERNKDKLIDILKWGALFGGSIGVLLFENISDEEMSQPLSLEKIKGKRFKIYVTDRWYGVSSSYETVENMSDIDFGKPAMYNISFADGKTYNVHHSYVLRYEHRNAPQLIKTGQLQGWGYAEGAHILNELSRDDQLKSAITSLVNKSLIEVIKMSGMRGVFMGTDAGNEEQLRKRLEMVNWARSYNSLTLLDKDDDYIQHQFSGLNGLSQLLEINMWLIAAALEMQGVLFGDLKGGLSQESDAFHRYAITIKNRCNSLARPVLQKFLQICFAVCDIDERVKFDFDSLEKDVELNAKIESMKNFTGYIQNLLDSQLIDKFSAISAIENYITNGTINIQFDKDFKDVVKTEADYRNLEVLKEISKEKPGVLESQFGANAMPKKLDYLNPSVPEEEDKINIREITERSFEQPSETPSEAQESTESIEGESQTE